MLRSLFLVLLLLTSAPLVAQTPSDSKDALLTQAEQRVRRGDYSAALEIYEQLIDLDPSDAQLYWLQTVPLAFLEEYDSALASVDRAISLWDGEPDFQIGGFLLRAEINVLAGDEKQALADYAAAIALDEDDPRAYRNRAMLNERIGELDAAIADYDLLTELTPEDINLYTRQADLYIDLEDYDSAKSALDAALEAIPDNPELYILRAKVQLLLADEAAAAADYLAWLDGIMIEVENLGVIESQQPIEITMQPGYQFNVRFEASAGMQLSFATRSVGVDPLVVLVGPDGDALIADDDGGRGLDVLLRGYSLPDDGEYTLVIGHARGGAEGEVEFAIILEALSTAMR